MHNELTQKDIELMRQELEYRRNVLRPQLIEDVQIRPPQPKNSRFR